MIVAIFGILQFTLCWRIICHSVELVKFIKLRPQTPCEMRGVKYIADRSRHPVPDMPVLREAGQTLMQTHIDYVFVGSAGE